MCLSISRIQFVDPLKLINKETQMRSLDQNILRTKKMLTSNE